MESFRKRLVDLPEPKEIMKMTRRNEAPSFEACVLYQFSWMKQRCSVKAATDGMSESAMGELGIQRFSSAEEAIEGSVQTYGRDATIVAVPYASITYVSPIPRWDVASPRSVA